MATDRNDSFFISSQAVTPVATAPDVLQRDKQSYLSVLIPVLDLTMDKLDDIRGANRDTLTFKGQLASWTKSHIKRRFESVLSTGNSENQKAAALHPACKLSWIESGGQRDRLQQQLELEVRQESGGSQDSDQRTATVD